MTEKAISFHDLSKQRQVRALQSYAESFRRVTATGSQRGGKSSRQMRRANAKRTGATPAPALKFWESTSKKGRAK